LKTKRYHNPTSFIDLLFLCLVGFVFLLVIAFLLIAPPIDDQQKKPKAEFLVTLTWDSETNDDVDLWIQDPANNVMFFREKEVGLMHLDRDDLGYRKDTVIVNGQQITQYTNQEIATIRGFVPGQWIINIHMYRKAWGEPANVNVRVDKLNPRFTTIVDKDYKMAVKGDEITVIRMTMDCKGKITNQDDVLSPFVSQRIITMGAQNAGE